MKNWKRNENYFVVWIAGFAFSRNTSKLTPTSLKLIIQSSVSRTAHLPLKQNLRNWENKKRTNQKNVQRHWRMKEHHWKVRFCSVEDLERRILAWHIFWQKSLITSSLKHPGYIKVITIVNGSISPLCPSSFAAMLHPINCPEAKTIGATMCAGISMISSNNCKEFQVRDNFHS